jgi:hypothetical protein
MQQTENELQMIKNGEDAEVLLASDTFNSTINNLVDQAFQNFVNSKPEQKEVRELSYNHYRALVEIVSTLQQRVAVKDQIKANADDNNQEEA